MLSQALLLARQRLEALRAQEQVPHSVEQVQVYRFRLSGLHLYNERVLCQLQDRQQQL